MSNRRASPRPWIHELMKAHAKGEPVALPYVDEHPYTEEEWAIIEEAVRGSLERTNNPKEQTNGNR